MSLTTTNIDEIIKLIDQITETLTKSDFLTPQEQQLLEQYREYERCTHEIQNWERLLIASRRGGEYKCIKLIKHYKNKRDSIRTPYDPDKSSILQHKLSKAQTDYIQSTLPPLQKKLDLYLTPRWPEILHLSTQGQLRRNIEQHFIFVEQNYPLLITLSRGNDILTAKKKKVIRELKRIKAKLEYQQAKTERKIKPVKERKQKNRPTKAQMTARNSAVLVAAIKLEKTYGRLPSVDEIVRETSYTADQIYATAPYKEGKIAKRSARLTPESTGSSVAASEQFGEKSIEHSRANRLSKSEQLERDKLIDESRADNARDEKQRNRYLRNKKRIDAQEY